LNTVVAIHQPNFLPWLGYFHKIARSDSFVVLDNVQLVKTSASWSNRVRVLVQGAPAWISLPLVRSYHGQRQIRDIEIDMSRRWQRTILNTVRMNYARAPYFRDVFPLLSQVIESAGPSLCDLNLHFIRLCCASLGIDTTKLVLASTLEAAGTATDLLASLVKAVGGTAYLAGGGASGYQEDEKFGAEGLGLVYQNFQHPSYPQQGSGAFVAGLSLIDAAMNCGWDGTRSLLSS
jgi:hypothetical protein